MGIKEKQGIIEKSDVISIKKEALDIIEKADAMESIDVTGLNQEQFLALMNAKFFEQKRIETPSKNEPKSKKQHIQNFAYI
ncbi:hypothetical protein B0187_09930 [Haemophilus paracuniculus]|uniref:Uncharacterized protein n=1 Tax=Haemophilus paracuniculus TaxID=734 RepID=A0A1T0AN41_9PAST|nr:hypothetical protein [Haemophilus paracuniculus]OOR97182.1 hypothetical protein B0187_09930 [Haemophilus paracuniculus]